MRRSSARCNRRFLALWAWAAAAVIAAQACAEDPLDDLPPVPVAPGTVTDQTDPRWSKPRIAAKNSQPITPDELRHYAIILHLSAEQRAVIREAYLGYRRRTDALYEKYGPEIAASAYEAADTQAHPYDKEYLRLLTALRETEARLQNDLMKEDRAFLAAMLECLAEPQIAQFERVDLRRQRKCCQPYLIKVTPGYIDLVELVQKQINDLDVLGDLDQTLLAYERRITPLHVDLNRIVKDAELEDVRELVASRYSADRQTLLKSDSPEGQARLGEYVARSEQRSARSMPPQEQLAAITRETIVAIEAIVPPDQREALHREYLRMAYPYIHPDRCDPTSLLTRMLNAPDLTPDLHQAIQERMDQWRATYARMTTEMEKHYDEYSVIFARTSSSEREHTQAIRKLRLARLELSEEAVESIFAMLPAEAQASFAKSVSYFQQGAAQFREQETNPRRGNP